MIEITLKIIIWSILLILLNIFSGNCSDIQVRSLFQFVGVFMEAGNL